MDDPNPAARLADLLRHPNDLDKIAALKADFARKKAAVDARLAAGLRDQLGHSQSAISALADGQTAVVRIRDELANIDRLCAESQTLIRDFSVINLVSRAHRNFAAVQAMLADLTGFNERLAAVDAMLVADQADPDSMPNLLPCHYELTRLRNIRDDAMDQIRRADDPSLLHTLEDYFERLNPVVSRFDDQIASIASSLVDLVMSDNSSLIVRYALIIDAEERSDRRVRALRDALRDHSEMAARFQSIAGGGARQVRGYKDRMVAAIRAHAAEQLAPLRQAFTDDPSTLDRQLQWFFRDLNAVKIGMVPLMPPRWNILGLYADIYHRLMHDFLIGIIDDSTTTSAAHLEIVAFPTKYYKKLARLGIRADHLAPHVIDNREAELVRDFRQRIIRHLDEFIDRIFALERKEFGERASPNNTPVDAPPGASAAGSNLESDEWGYFRTRHAVDLWRMLLEQVDVASNSSRADVVEGVVDAIFLRLRARHHQWQKLLDDEALRYTSGKTPELDGFQPLQDWLLAIANDQIACIDDADPADSAGGAAAAAGGAGGGAAAPPAPAGRLAYLSNFRHRFEPLVTPPFLERIDGEITALRDSYVDMSTWCITHFARLIFAVDFKGVLADIFTPKWYSSTAVKQMMVTFDEYVADYRPVLHHSLVDIFVEIFADELLVRYLGCVRNKGAKFRRSDRFQEMLFSDIAAAFDQLDRMPVSPDALDSIKRSWRVTENFLALLSCDRAQAANVYADFKTAYWDLQLSWVEAVLRSRDDFERSMLNAVKARAAQLDVPRGPETIMAKVK